MLSGKTHLIHTSLAILDGCGGPGLQTIEQVAVEMLPYGEGEIERYLAREESMDKAGAYSIQGDGRKLIASIRGDYLAAVGMPLRPLADYLRERGVDLPVNVEGLYGQRNFLNWRSFG